MKFNGFASFVIGVSTGATVMLFFAPQSGKATRRYVRRRLDDGRDSVEHGMARVREIAEDVEDKGREAIQCANRVFSTVVKAGSSAASVLL